MAVAELAAYWLMAPIGSYAWTYWNDRAVDKFEWYRINAEHGCAPTVLAIGDSTGAQDFVPASFSSAAGGVDAYNLAWGGNFPLALPATTFPFLELPSHPGYVLLFQAPDTFVDSEKVRGYENRARASIYGRRALGETIPADYLHLSQLYPARRLLVDYWLHGRLPVAAPKHAGFLPIEEQPIFANRPSPGLAMSWPSADQLDERRMRTILDLSRISKREGYRLIVVLVPVATRPTPPIVRELNRWVHGEAESRGFTVWDFTTSPFLGDRDFWNALHLNSEGARLFSSRLGARFAGEFGAVPARRASVPPPGPARTEACIPLPKD